MAVSGWEGWVGNEVRGSGAIRLTREPFSTSTRRVWWNFCGTEFSGKCLTRRFSYRGAFALKGWEHPLKMMIGSRFFIMSLEQRVAWKVNCSFRGERFEIGIFFPGFRDFVKNTLSTLNFGDGFISSKRMCSVYQRWVSTKEGAWKIFNFIIINFLSRLLF